VNSDGSGVNRIGSGVTAPIPLNSVEAHYTKEARKARIQGNCYVSVVIDANGMPQNPKVIRSLDPGLDQNALDAVSKYRFKPAMKDGHPVPVMLTIQVSYKIQ
jgi:protein TonB